MQPKLIILRGPSGAGKSTVARELQKQTKRKLAVIEQDRYRQEMFRDQAGSSEVRHVMLATDCLIALEYGYDVILEGILSVESYQGVFDMLSSKHVQENYMFYFDISYEETVKRHASRPKSTEFSADEMKVWYTLAQKSDLDWEVIISEKSTFKETVTLIQTTAGM